MSAVLDDIRAKYDKAAFYYETDIRNTGRVTLLRKFDEKYEIIEQGFERLPTDSGKELELQEYILKAK